MLEQAELDVLYFFNVTLSSSALDAVMSFLTNSRNWIPVYVLASLLLVWKYKRSGVLVVVTVALLVGTSNLLTNTALKEIIGRPRPCATDAFGRQIISWIRLPDGMRHGYSMPSSHAVNNFAVAAFFMFFFRKNTSLVYVLVCSAIIVSITRLYLGLHYPSDTFVGAVFGTILGVSFAKLLVFVQKKYFPGKLGELPPFP